MSEQKALERRVFEMFADAHPHEAAEQNWEWFVQYARGKIGVNIPEKAIRELLRETEGADGYVRRSKNEGDA